MCVTQLVQIVVFLCLSTLGVLCSQRGLQIIRPPRSHTVMMDRRLKLYCKTLNGNSQKVHITWFHDGEPMKGQDKYFDINSGGSILRFTKVKVLHRGKYKCRAENESKDVVVSKVAHLVVHAPASIVEKEEKIYKKEKEIPVGSKTYISCTAAGIPTPVITWRKNGEILFIPGKDYPYEKSKETVTSDVTLRSVLKIVVMESAVYTCFVLNIPIGGIRNDSMDVRVKATHPVPNDMQVGRAAKQESHQRCAPYKGTFCKEFLDGRTVLHDDFNVTSGLGRTEETLSLLWEEVEVLGLFNSKSNRVRDDYCRGPAKRLLCHTAFPDCDNHTGRPLDICKESCLAVQSLFCFQPWAELDEMKLKGKVLKNKGDFSLPDCGILPSKWNTSQSCVDSNHHQFSPEKVTDECYVDRGRWYNGTVNVTVSGKTCQAWHVHKPQKHERSPLIFPELAGAENFCRNPGDEEDQPWCYTTDKLPRWEKCNIMPCGKTTDLVKPAEKISMDDEEIKLIIVITVPCIVILVFIAILVIVRRRCMRTPYDATPQDDMEIDISNVPVNSAYHQMKSNRLDPKLEPLEFPRNDIEYIRDLGQGAFGRVFKARLVCSSGNSRITGGKINMSDSMNCDKTCKQSKVIFSSKADLASYPNDCNSSLLNPQFMSPTFNDTNEFSYEDHNDQFIAVKMLKEDASEAIQGDFEREASLMVNFDHPNIVRLLGVCTIGKPMCLLFEYMSKGDLNEFLRQCSLDQSLITSKTDSLQRMANRTKLDLKDQLKIAHQIASGMSYLSDRGYVHRDLATRNCLISCDLIVKIADFGLARSVHSMNYYHGSDKDAIPIRWMPPEAILYNKFSSLSDVWSFGVLLWEIFSFALQPYYGMTHEEVINYLCENKVLQCPDNTPPAIYDLMKSCWKRKPKERPKFTSLNRSLSVMYEDRKKRVTEEVSVCM